jgi:hypothetical protein
VDSESQLDFIATTTNARLRFMETESWLLLQQLEFTPRRLFHSKCCGQIVVHQSMAVGCEVTEVKLPEVIKATASHSSEDVEFGGA